MQSRRSKVLMLSIDALRSDCVRANEDKRRLRYLGVTHMPETPTLDALLGRGTTFTSCFTAAPYTSAAHAAIFTGLMTVNNGIREHYRTALFPRIETLFTHFKRAGYVTVLANDMQAIFSHNLGLTSDVDHYVAMNDRKVGQILTERSDEPVFCFWHIANIHSPFGLCSLEIDGARFRAEVELIAGMAGVEYSPDGPRQLNMEALTDPEELLLRKRYFQALRSLYEQRRYADIMNLYIRSMEHMDRHRLASIVALLEGIGWLDHGTLCIFGDHGEEYSDRCFMHHTSVTDGAINVPLTFVAPDLPRNAVDKSVVRTIDIAPTLLELAGLEPRQSLDGVSLVAHMKNRLPTGAVAIGELFQHAGEDEIRRRNMIEQAVHERTAIGSLDWPLPSIHKLFARDNRWKIAVDRDLIGGGERVELFDCENDVLELKNVAAEYPRAVRSLYDELSMLLQRQLDPADSVRAVNPRRISAELENMGYLRGRDRFGI
jgi:arylsulfatase A-like enzyme